jgi:hypothetical protein
MERKQHWERVYETKDLTAVSWFQPARHCRGVCCWRTPSRDLSD